MFQRSGSLAFAWSDDPLRYSIPESDEEKLKRIQLLYIQKAQYRYRKLGEYTFNDAKSQSFIYGDCFLKKQIYCYIDDPVNPTVKKNVPCHEVVDIKTLSHKRPCIGIAKPQGLKNLNLTNPF